MLLGRQLRSVTTYEYDEETGRLARAITVHESPWTELDADYALAHEANQADMCPGGCGHPLSETTARRNKVPVHSYTASLMRCEACTEKARTQEEHAKKGKVPQPEAVMWGVTKDT